MLTIHSHFTRSNKNKIPSHEDHILVWELVLKYQIYRKECSGICNKN